MNLKKLEELDAQKESRKNALNKELTDLKARRDSINDSMSAVVLSSSEKEVDKLVNELSMIETKIKVIDDALKLLSSSRNYLYSDDDVLEGYKDFSADYEKQFSKLHSEYRKNLDDAFASFQKIVELRKKSKAIRNGFASHLTSKPLTNEINRIMPLSTLDRRRGQKDNMDFLPWYNWAVGAAWPKDYELDLMSLSDI